MNKVFVSTSDFQNPRPFVRYFAKVVDVLLYVNVLLLIILTVDQEWCIDLLTRESWGKRIIFFFLLIILDSFIVHLAATSPGKYLLSTKITDKDGNKPTLANSFKRNLILWLAGFGLGLIPFITFLLFIFWAFRVKSGKETIWDKVAGTLVIHSNLALMKVIGFFVLWLGSVFIPFWIISKFKGVD